ncbi:MAG: HD-GYP domain-containing protein [Spirochaetales bacterium]|nr:HD-GYP domain-containing protein [Spirochaetales bacterium]
MKKIKVDDLKSGMRFSAPVYLDGENLLVPENIEIKEKDIKRLIRWNIEYVETEGNPVSAELSEEKNDGLADFKGDKSVLKTYTKIVNRLDVVFKDIKGYSKADKVEIDNIITDVFSLLRDKPEELKSMTMISLGMEFDLVQSSLNCMIVSIILGRQLKIINSRLISLAVAALLHDIGMTKLPEVLLEKKSDLTEDELKVIHLHPLYTYKLITKSLKYKDEIGRIALHHHERWDGRGYPDKLSGKEIPFSSRIISVADAYGAMLKDRPYRGSMIGYKAMREILNDNSRRFDSGILKVFIKSMGIYPLGSLVILNDSSIARVSLVHNDAPLRPTLQILMSPAGRILKGDSAKFTDLISEKDLFIVRAISRDEIKTQGTGK